ncbi:MAG TPA: hypothetical protein DD640_02560 [Clostridiales bacterium]|nr:hypothetical protein [Clostridiales bacterium]
MKYVYDYNRSFVLVSIVGAILGFLLLHSGLLLFYLRSHTFSSLEILLVFAIPIVLILLIYPYLSFFAKSVVVIDDAGVTMISSMIWHLGWENIRQIRFCRFSLTQFSSCVKIYGTGGIPIVICKHRREYVQAWLLLYQKALESGHIELSGSFVREMEKIRRPESKLA